MNLGGLGILTAPLQSPTGGFQRGVSAESGLQPQQGAFQIPTLSPETPSAAQLPPILGTDHQVPANLGGRLDDLVQSFLEEMQEKTGLAPNLLMSGIEQSLQKLPDVKEMLQTFSDHVRKAGVSQGLKISAADLQTEMRVFLKELQNTLSEAAAQDDGTSQVGRKFEFEVLNEGQVRDRRTQSLVDRLQKDFFGVQAARPEPLSAEQFSEALDTAPRARLAEPPRISTTDQFFATKQKESQLLERLRHMGAPPQEAALAPVALMDEQDVKAASSTGADSALAFDESLLDQIAVVGPQVGADTPQNLGAKEASAFQAALKAHIPADAKVENLGEIIQNARMAATSGGGEMEMDLKPEGLGKVQVKVIVQGDQVQVQMTAENKRVQDLLKDGLQDLRSQLAVHKLHSEALRVDGTSTGQEADLGRRDTAQDQQQRNFAQGFMQQFREERESARGGMTRFPDAEGPSSRRSTDVVRPLNHSPRVHEGRLSLIA